MARNPNWTVVGGTMGQITIPFEDPLVVEDDDEDDNDAPVEEQEENNEHEESLRGKRVWKIFSLSLKSKLAFSVFEIVFLAFLLWRIPIMCVLHLNLKRRL